MESLAQAQLAAELASCDTRGDEANIADGASEIAIAKANRRSETETHLRLKRLALLWAQANGYSACAVEVSLPRTGYRADVAAYRGHPNQPGVTAIFECKQALADLRRDNCCSERADRRLHLLSQRRAVIEKHLRTHYPTLRTGDSLFAEYDSYDFSSLRHQNYKRVLREYNALQHRLKSGRKFECLARYRCANLFFLVVPDYLDRALEVPIGWGTLVESEGALTLACKPVWHEIDDGNRLRLLQRIAAAGTRQINRTFGITHEEIETVARLG